VVYVALQVLLCPYTNPISNKENGAYKIIQKFYSFDVENEK